jgi:hypothetical protein
MRELGITPNPKSTVKEMESFLENNRSRGYVVRLLKPPSRLPEDMVSDFIGADTFWLPDTEKTKGLIETRLFLVLQRCFLAEMPKGVRAVVG